LRSIGWSKDQHGHPMCLPDLPTHLLHSSSQNHPWNSKR
jgi:hypothetical protein